MRQILQEETTTTSQWRTVCPLRCPVGPGAEGVVSNGAGNLGRWRWHRYRAGCQAVRQPEQVCCDTDTALAIHEQHQGRAKHASVRRAQSIDLHSRPALLFLGMKQPAQLRAAPNQRPCDLPLIAGLLCVVCILFASSSRVLRSLTHPRQPATRQPN